MGEAAEKFRMRAMCSGCGGTDGRVESRGGQDCVFCMECGKFAYNAPRTETGREVRTVSTVHEAIKPKQRARIIARATLHCELCGASGLLHVGHIVSVKRSVSLGWTDAEINDDENLAAMCEQCNLGLGADMVPLRIILAIYMRRLRPS